MKNILMMAGITNPTKATCFAIAAVQFVAGGSQICDILANHYRCDKRSGGEMRYIYIFPCTN